MEVIFTQRRQINPCTPFHTCTGYNIKQNNIEKFFAEKLHVFKSEDLSELGGFFIIHFSDQTKYVLEAYFFPHQRTPPLDVVNSFLNW